MERRKNEVRASSQSCQQENERNPGNGTAIDVNLQDPFPDGVYHAKQHPHDADCQQCN